jgi:hypothetical protein
LALGGDTARRNNACTSRTGRPLRPVSVVSCDVAQRVAEKTHTGKAIVANRTCIQSGPFPTFLSLAKPRQPKAAAPAENDRDVQEPGNDVAADQQAIAESIVNAQKAAGHDNRAFVDALNDDRSGEVVRRTRQQSGRTGVCRPVVWTPPSTWK